MKSTNIYIWLMALLMATIGCAKYTTVNLTVTDDQERNIQDAKLEATVNGEEVLVEYDEMLERWSAKVKSGQYLLVEGHKDGYDSATDKRTVEGEFADFELQLKLLQPALGLIATLNPPKVVAGATQTEVTITVENNGYGDARGVRVRGHIPSGFQSQTHRNAKRDGDSWVWNVGSLIAKTGRAQVSYLLAPNADKKTGEFTVKVEGGGKNRVNDPLEPIETLAAGYNTGQAIIAVNSNNELPYQVASTNISLTQSEQVRYSIGIENTGGGSTAEIELYVSFPQGVTLSPTGVMLNSESLSPDRVIQTEDGSYTLTLPPLEPERQHEVAYTATVSKELKVGSKTSRVTLTTYDEAEAKIERFGEATFKIIEVPQPAKLSITKSMWDGAGISETVKNADGTPSFDSEGKPKKDYSVTLECELSIKNDGLGAARQMTIKEALPAGFSVLRVEEPKGQKYSDSSSELVWHLDTLRAKGEIQIRYQLKGKQIPREWLAAESPEGVITTPLQVTVEAYDEWEREIEGISTNATYSKTDIGTTGVQPSRFTGRGAPPTIRQIGEKKKEETQEHK